MVVYSITCLVLSTGPDSTTIAWCLILQNIIAPIVGAEIALISIVFWRENDHLPRQAREKRGGRDGQKSDGVLAGTAARPMMIEMSAKYAAAIQGAVNCADNLTLYALSATLNGLFLDSGGCRPLPLSADIAEEKVEEQAGECVGFICLST